MISPKEINTFPTLTVFYRLFQFSMFILAFLAVSTENPHKYYKEKNFP